MSGGTFPTSPAFTSVNIQANNPSIVTLASSGRRQVKTQNTQYWSFKATLPPMTRAQWAPIAAFIMTQRGARYTFNVQLPQYSFTQGNLNSPHVVEINGAHSRGDTTISLNAWTDSGKLTTLTQTDGLKAGDFISFAPDHQKVYMVIEDVDFTSGSGSLTIEPGLQVDVGGGEGLVYDNVSWQVFLMNDTQEFSMNAGNTVGYELEFREAL